MKLAKLRSQLAEGISDIEQGNATIVTSKESLKELFDYLKEKADVANRLSYSNLRNTKTKPR